MELTSKALNRKTVLDVFRNSQYMTWTEVSEATGQSPSTVHRAIEFLRKKNLLVVAGKGPSTDNGGKRPLLLTLNGTYRYILCFYIQIDAVSTSITDLRGSFLVEKTVSFPQNSSLQTVLDHMRQSFENLAAGLDLKESDFAGAAVGSNGVVDALAGMLSSAPNFSSWGNNIPLKNLVEGIFQTKSAPPVHVDNSNRFDAYAEYRVGQARGVDNFMIINGHADGFGAAFVIDGKLRRGKHNLAGEFGHLTIDPKSKRICYCGARGCLESIASMVALEEEARNGFQDNRKSSMFSHIHPDEVSYMGIYNSANAGDAFARELVAKQAGHLAIGLSAAAILVDPDVVILQGSFVAGGDFLLDTLRKKCAELGLPRIENKLKILYSSLPRDKYRIGQAHYVADIFFQTPEFFEI